MLEELSAVGALEPTITKTIGGSDLDWALGAAVVHFSTHEKQLTQLWAGHGWKLLPQGSAGDSGGIRRGRIGYSLIASTLFYHPFEIFAVIAIILALTFFSIKKKRGGRSGQIDGAKRQLHMNKDVALVKSV